MNDNQLTPFDDDSDLPPDLERRQGLADDRDTPVDRRNGWDRRRGPGRRRTDDRRAAEEGDMSDEQFDFIMAIKNYKQANNCLFPTYTEILEIAKALGYRKVAQPQPINPKKSP